MFIFMFPDIWKTQNTVEQNVERPSGSLAPFAEIGPLKMCSYHVAHLKWNKTQKAVFWSV